MKVLLPWCVAQLDVDVDCCDRGEVCQVADL